MRSPLHGILICLSLFASPLLNAQTTVAEWQAKAVQTYPALKEPDSDFNREFLKLYREKKAADPAFFQRADWPWTLANQIAQASAPPPAPAIAEETPPPAPEPVETEPEPVEPASAQTANVPPGQTLEWEADRVPESLGLVHAKFRWWAPDGIKPRGVLVLAPGRGGDGRGMATQKKWQAIASEHHLGIIGCALKNRADTPFAYQQDPDGATSDLIDRAVDALVTQSGHKGKPLPLFFYGHSAGANVAQNYGDRKARRMLGAVLMRCPNGSGTYNPEKGNVPLLIFVGAKDRAEWVETSIKRYEEGLSKRAVWTFAMHRNEGHGVGNTGELTETFVNSVLSQRLGKPGSSEAPKKLQRTQGWLGDPDTFEVGPANQFKGKKGQATWLPDEATAKLWQSYLRN